VANAGRADPRGCWVYLCEHGIVSRYSKKVRGSRLGGTGLVQHERSGVLGGKGGHKVAHPLTGQVTHHLRVRAARDPAARALRVDTVGLAHCARCTRRLYLARPVGPRTGDGYASTIAQQVENPVALAR
jgi:hypothetical protein